MSEKSMKTKEYNRIEDVPRETSLAFLGDGDRQLLSLLEKLNPCDQRYYLGKNAFLITYRQEINLLSFLGWGKIPYTLRIVGFPVSLVKKGYFGNSEEISALICSLKGFTLVLNGEKDLRLPRGYTLSSYRLYLPDRTFEEYLGRMRSPYRYRLNKALKKQSLYHIRPVPREEFTEELYELYKEVFQRSEAPLECLALDFFKEMPGEILVFEKGEEEPGRVLGFLFLSHQQDTLNFLFGGFLEKDVKKYDLYYGMLMEMVKVAINKGAKYLELGQTAEETKAKLGAREEKKHLYLSHSNPIINRMIPLFLWIGSYQPGKHRYRVFKED